MYPTKKPCMPMSYHDSQFVHSFDPMRKTRSTSDLRVNMGLAPGGAARASARKKSHDQKSVISHV